MQNGQGYLKMAWIVIVKLQSKSKSPKLRLGVDFVFPLSQQEEEQEEEWSHQNLSEGKDPGGWNFVCDLSVT